MRKAYSGGTAPRVGVANEDAVRVLKTTVANLVDILTSNYFDQDLISSTSPMTQAPSSGKEKSSFPLIPSSPGDDSWAEHIAQPDSGLHIGVFSLQGKRPYQEDEFAIRQYLGSDQKVAKPATTHFFGLFDGHAGGRCSKHISSSLPDILAEDGLFSSNLPLALKRSFHTVNDDFLAIAEQQRLHDGSTGICSAIRNGKLLVGNVGDCRCLLLSAGKPIQMSIDQKPTNPDEVKRIISLGGTITNNLGVARVNGVLAVSRAFGNRKLRRVIRPDIEMMQRDLTRDDDFLIMASDGLWDVLRNKDVSDICYALTASHRPQQLAEELVHTAIARGSMDNVTCIVVQLTGYINKMSSGDIKCESNTSAFVNVRPQPQFFNMKDSGPASAGQGQSQSQFDRVVSNRGNNPVVRDTESADSHRNLSGLSGGGPRHTSSKPSGTNRSNSFTVTSTTSKLDYLSGSAGAGHNFNSLTSAKNSRGSGSSGSYGNNTAEGNRYSELWGPSGPDPSGGMAMRPWTVSASPNANTSTNPLHQGRQSPPMLSASFFFDNSHNQHFTAPDSSTASHGNRHSQRQHTGYRAAPTAEDLHGTSSERLNSETDDPPLIIRPHPQLSTGYPKSIPTSLTNRIQQGQGPQSYSTFSLSSNHDPRNGFTPARDAYVSRTPGSSSKSSSNTSRASSASAATVRHNQSMNSMPKLHSKTSLESNGQTAKVTDSTFFPAESSFQISAASTLPTFGNNSTASQSMRPLNSPIAFLTAAAERQRSASTGQNLPPNRQVTGAGTGVGVGAVTGAGGDSNRAPPTFNRKVTQMRIAYA